MEEIYDPFNEERPIGYKDNLIDEVRKEFGMEEEYMPDMITIDYSFVVSRYAEIYLKDLEKYEGNLNERIEKYMYEQEDVYMITSGDDCDGLSEYTLNSCYDNDGEVYYT